MSKKVIIVESPAKARTIGNILGKDYVVSSSVGHIRDLPKTRFGVDTKNEFKPDYVTISGKQKVVDKIKKIAQKADEIYLAADSDREGEAICWHLAHYLKDYPGTIYRILYYEITPKAITDSLKSPKQLNMQKVNAQQARRVLDRIVGYRLSPLLWKKIRGGLSAGRVQSVALKIVCDREREIQAFVPQEYWVLTANLRSNDPPDFQAVYHGLNNKKQKLPDKQSTDTVLNDIKNNPFIVSKLSRRKVNRRPPAPFITSTLQQEAAHRFRFPTFKTMKLAQTLYEGKGNQQKGQHGLITYMRTDSPRISKSAQNSARAYIKDNFGSNLVPKSPPWYKARKGAQEAHEAIRPTSVSLTPERAAQFLTGDALKLYRLIWERFIGSQMSPAILNITTATIDAGENRQHQFRAVGTEVLFEGYWKLTGSSPQQSDSKFNQASKQVLPSLNTDDILECLKLDSQQKFTKPPSRFSEASLVKELEMKGIGRPSTYAAIMSTIRNQDYVIIESRKFKPTELGFLVSDLLTEHFPQIMSIDFTASLEKQLDSIENGNEKWVKVVEAFYKPFEKHLIAAQKKIKPQKPALTVVDNVECPECNGPMVMRKGKKGKFLSCKAFPKCKGSLPFNRTKYPKDTKSSLIVKIQATCSECNAPLLLRTGRYGLFSSCSQFPKCRAKGPSAKGLRCPKENCDGELVLKRTKQRKTFFGCSNYPECKYIFSDVTVIQQCPSCEFEYLGAAVKNGIIQLSCPRCNYKITPEVKESGDNGDSNSKVSNIS